MDAGDTEEIKLTGLGSKLDPSGQKLFLCFSQRPPWYFKGRRDPINIC